MVQKRLGWKWSGFWMGSEIWKPNHLKSGHKCLVFKWSSFQMVGTIAIAKAQPFENRTIWNLTFKKSWFQMFPDLKWLDFRSPLYTLLYNSLSWSLNGNYLPLVKSRVSLCSHSSYSVVFCAFVKKVVCVSVCVCVKKLWCPDLASPSSECVLCYSIRPCLNQKHFFYPPSSGISSCIRTDWAVMCLHTWHSPAN